MKVGIIALFLIYLQDVFSVNYSNGIFHEKSPKKNFQIVISNKYLKPPLVAKIKKPKPDPVVYTAFPAMGDSEKKLYNVPDSPYFQTDLPQKQSYHKIKKMLTDHSYYGFQRKKRAVSTQDDTKTEGLDKEPEPDKAEINTNKTKTARKSFKDHQKIKLQRSKTYKRRLRSNANGTKLEKRLKKRRNAKRNNRNRRKSLKKGRSDKKRNNRTSVQKQAMENRRLIAARDAIIEDFPYVVSIQKDGEHWCSGAILNPRLVITTANCLWKSSSISRMRVRAGSRNLNSGGQTAKIQEVMKHPNWSIRKGPDNDIGLLLLDRNLKFSDSVHGVDLPNRMMKPAFQDAWVTSWGADRRDGVYDKTDMTLQSIHTRLLDREKCNNITKRYGVTVTENFICLSQLGQRAPCTRDTGAPAVSDGVLWGLASWGIRKLCGTQRFPAMFSYVASHTNMDFITTASRSLMADERHYPFLDKYQARSVAESPKPT